MIKIFVCTFVIVSASFRAVGQQIDWEEFFHEALSRNRAIQDAARDKGLLEFLPLLCQGEVKRVAPEIPGLLKQMDQSNPDVRVQASAFLYTMALFRVDSGSVLSAAVPVLIDHVQTDVASQTRKNCVDALVELKPDIPAQVLPHMLNWAKSDDEAVYPDAIVGLARMANTYREATEELQKFLSESDSTTRKKLVIQGIGNSRATDTQLLRALGVFLSDKSTDLQRAALQAINKYGDVAVATNREQLVKFAANSPDRELAALAKNLIDKAQAK